MNTAHQDPTRTWLESIRATLGVEWHAAPRLGEPEWHALKDGDPLKTTAVLRAAGCWHQHCSREHVEEDLREDLAEREWDFLRRFRMASWDVSAALDWRQQATEPTFAELQQRRRAS